MVTMGSDPQATVACLSGLGLAAALWGALKRPWQGKLLAHHNIEQWHEANKDLFAPPICNKVMHKDEMTIMYDKFGSSPGLTAAVSFAVRPLIWWATVRQVHRGAEHARGLSPRPR
jgi:hypothetical protein